VRRVDNLPTSCAFVTKSGNLNFLEPSGTVQACNGATLLFTAQLTSKVAFYIFIRQI
jgi:hypothetical protein